MKYSQALREAAADNVRCLAHRSAWRDLNTGLVALAFLLLRLVMLLTYPISTPLMAWAILADHKRRLSAPARSVYGAMLCDRKKAGGVMRMAAKGQVCSAEGCGQPVRCKGVCERHYGALKAQRKMKPCACGCGEQTAHTFKHGHHTRLFTPEEQARRGRMNNGDKQRDPPGATWYRKVHGRHEHRVVMEQIVGRALGPDEIVHHRDEDKRNNAPDNLELMTRTEHINEHRPALLAGQRTKRQC